MRRHELMILPRPQRLENRTGSFAFRTGQSIVLPCPDKEELFGTAVRLQTTLAKYLNLKLPLLIQEQPDTGTAVLFSRCPHYQKEEYSLEIGDSRIEIGYGDPAGAFHAVSTLRQLIRQCGKTLPCLWISDWPDFPVRGLMLDISRDKIPRMETLYRIVDLIADVKLNHFELYIQGFSFAYPSFPQVWADGTPITGEEMVRLSRYCRERFIDFVPNQNSFGHMGPWLARSEFRHLAECPDGFMAPWGWLNHGLCLNPLDDNSLEFLKTTYADLLPCFDSAFFNIGGDETHDLGLGKNKDVCEKLGKGRVYLDFLKKIHGLLKERGKKMMFWGDIILKFPELIPELPRDCTVLQWGYEADQPLESDCEKFEKAGIPYYICPSTNVCSTIVGRTSVMKSNLLNAAVRGKEHGAIGYLNTDWGDYGHWQPLPVSYAPYCLGAALSWSVEQNRDIDVAAYLDTFIFEDRCSRMGRFMLDAGDYLPEQPDHDIGTGIFRLLYFFQLDGTGNPISSLKQNLKRDYFAQIKQRTVRLMDDLDGVEMQCDDAELIEAEMRLSLRLILHGANLGLLKTTARMGKDRKRCKLEELRDDLTVILRDYRENWLRRNRSGGLDDSVRRLEDLKRQYEKAIQDIQRDDTPKGGGSAG